MILLLYHLPLLFAFVANLLFFPLHKFASRINKPLKFLPMSDSIEDLYWVNATTGEIEFDSTGMSLHDQALFLKACQDHESLKAASVLVTPDKFAPILADGKRNYFGAAKFNQIDELALPLVERHARQQMGLTLMTQRINAEQMLTKQATKPTIPFVGVSTVPHPTDPTKPQQPSRIPFNELCYVQTDLLKSSPFDQDMFRETYGYLAKLGSFGPGDKTPQNNRELAAHTTARAAALLAHASNVTHSALARIEASIEKQYPALHQNLLSEFTDAFRPQMLIKEALANIQIASRVARGQFQEPNNGQIYRGLIQGNDRLPFPTASQKLQADFVAPPNWTHLVMRAQADPRAKPMWNKRFPQRTRGGRRQNGRGRGRSNNNNNRGSNQNNGRGNNNQGRGRRNRRNKRKRKNSNQNDAPAPKNQRTEESGETTS